ncbi:MAG: hypothetical protein JSV86_09705 [Gemmatimonadota bacterium]|nr:MAG: hypothetical protein JSV86_09705 [Gemmatimonadota bacterium]
MPKYKFHTLQVNPKKPFVGGPSARGQTLGAGVEALHAAVSWLGGLGLAWRISQEFKRLEPQVQKAMPRDGGVLVCIGVKEWEHHDAAGAKARMFLNMHIAGAGKRPDQILDRYLKQPRIVQGAPRGWVRKDEFIWVTPAD